MSLKPAPVIASLGKLILAISFLFGFDSNGFSQMREIYSSPLASIGAVKKIDFYSAREGFVAFTDAIGFTSDSGRSFLPFTYITKANVDFSSTGIDPDSKFRINGLEAFDRNNVVVYGEYPNAPAILKSTDGGKLFKVVLATVGFNGQQHKGGITDMLTLKERNVILAIDAEHIYRSVTKGLSWDTIQTIPDAWLTDLDGFENGRIYAWSATNPQNYIYRSGIDGSGFTPVAVRGGTLRTASFINSNEGYIAVNGVAGPEVYFTMDGGGFWMHTLHPGQTQRAFTQLKFIDVATGYGLVNRNDIYQTSDSGHSWQKIPRTNGLAPTQDLALFTLTTFDGSQLWTGGEGPIIEINTQLPAPPMPEALFSIDTSGFSNSRQVRLSSYSPADVMVYWYINDLFHSSTPVTSYTSVAGRLSDTIKLIVTRRAVSDTGIKVQLYPSAQPPVDPPPVNPPPVDPPPVNPPPVDPPPVNPPPVDPPPVNPPPVDPPPVNPPPVDPPPVNPPPVDPPPVDPPPALPAIGSFSPMSAPVASVVQINGSNFKNVSAVLFGGTPATSFAVLSESLISAVVAEGTSGNIEVKTPAGTAALGGFTFISRPSLSSFTPVSAAMNQTVVIRGTNLATTSQVRFGPSDALTFAVVSDNEIHAVIGSGSSGFVSVVSAGGSDSIAGFTFNPPPAVFSVTPDRGIAGTTVTIMGQHFTGATKVEIGYSNVASFTIVSDTVIIAIIALQNHGEVSVTSVFGGSSGGPGYRYPEIPVINSFEPKVGGEGTRMKINMENFNYSVEQISVGGVPVKEWIPTLSLSFNAIIGKGASGRIGLHTADTTIFSIDSFEFVQRPTFKSFTPTSGKAGTIITLTGSNFHRTATVAFGGARAARVTVLSDSVMTAVVGSGASGDVQLETAGGKASLPGFTFNPSPVPTIQSFSPVFGKAGTIITIKGSNFNTEPAQNFVAFGAVYGKVMSATSSLLTVEVPAGASLSLLTVSSNGYIATANNFFTLTASDKRQLSDTTYRLLNVHPKAISFHSNNLQAADLDGDGKTDLVTASESFVNYTVYHNTTQNDSISFQEVLKPDLSVYQHIVVTDIDGDGRPDLIGGVRSIIRIFKNTSVPGKISFAEPQERIGGTYDFFRVADMNRDGKPEILAMGDQGEVHVFPNTSSGSTFTFGTRYRFPVLKSNSRFEVADLDADGRPEVLIATSRSDIPDRSLMIFANTSTLDTLSFKSPLPFEGGNVPQHFIVGDLNRDNKPDLVINYLYGINYLENTTQDGILSFKPAHKIFTAGYTGDNAMADLDGDGFADLIGRKDSDSVLYIYTQQNINNIISFVEKAQIKTTSVMRDITIRDLNNNGSPEVIFVGSDNKVHMYSADVFVKPADTCSITAAITQNRDSLCSGNQLSYRASVKEGVNNASYTWILNGIVKATNSIVYRDQQLKQGDRLAVVISGTTPCGPASDTSELVVIGPVISAQYQLSITTNAVDRCNQTRRTFSAAGLKLVDPAGNSRLVDTTGIIYRWRVNGQLKPTNTSAILITDLKQSDEVWLECIIMSPCKSETIVSNKIIVTVNTRPAVSVTISGKTEIETGGEALMSATVKNSPGGVRFHWEDSTSQHSWQQVPAANAQSIRYLPAKSGDKLRIHLAMIDSCNSRDTVVSVPVEFNIIESPAPMAGVPIRAFPNPAGNSVTLNNINLADNWQSLELIGTNGHRFMLLSDIRGRTTINLNLVNVPKGLYLVVFKRATGETAFVRIMKQ